MKKEGRQLTSRRFFRRVKWLFGKSGILSLGLEHFLAMVPATILVPILVNASVGEPVIDTSLVLLTSGLGTITFTIVSRGRIPAYLGSSFAYIGLTIYLIDSQTKGGIPPQMAYSYVGWSYVFSGLLLLLLSFLYKKENIDRILTFVLPASVSGPAISLIGLELADTAVLDAGFDPIRGVVDPNAVTVSIITLSVIVLCSLMKRRVLKNAAILVGLFAGFVAYFAVNGFPQLHLTARDIFAFNVPQFDFPLRYFPKNWATLLLAIVPVTLIVFTENLGRVTVINRMVDRNGTDTSIYSKESVKQLHCGLFSHGISSMAVTLMGSVPNTIYAENIAIMGIQDTEAKDDPDPMIKDLTKPYSVYPYLAAAAFAILFSFVGILQRFIIAIPKEIIGGMELFLFGIISAPGIQLLVEQRVNYKKVSNQIVTAAVLVTGVSGLSVNLAFVELKGMSLGFAVGILLNLLVQLLKWLGKISDTVDFDELVEECLSAVLPDEQEALLMDKHTVIFKKGERTFCNMDASELLMAFRGFENHVLIGDRKESAEWAIETVKHATGVDFTDGERVVFSIRKTANSLTVDLDENSIPFSIAAEFLNDYNDAIDTDHGLLRIDVAKSIPLRKVCELVKKAAEAAESPSEAGTPISVAQPK